MGTVDVSSLWFGLFCGIFIFCAAKLCEQTRYIWRHSHRLLNPYLFLVWGEMIVNVIFCILAFLFLKEVVPNGVPVLCGICLLWSFQTQLLPQVIVNRIGLIMVSRKKARNLKVIIAVPITLINIAVFYIWVNGEKPDATPSQIKLNYYFEKFEKSFFLVVDLALNLYFLYQVRYRLIASGLNKYWKLFHFNCAMVMVSTTLDALLLGFLSIGTLYVQFSTVVYLSKLYIELTMAHLIVKIVRTSGPSFTQPYNKGSAGTNGDAGQHALTNFTSVMASRQEKGQSIVRTADSAASADKYAVHEEEGRLSVSGSEDDLNPPRPVQCITKTVETIITRSDPVDQNYICRVA